MDPVLWKEIKLACAEALQIPARERHAYLDSLTQAVRSEVERLIAADQVAGSFIENPFLVEHGVVSPDSESKENISIEDYRLIKKLGSGGMGTVYLAEQVGDGFSHQVALKLIKRGMDSDVILRRFLMERQILASLDHPNVARMLDGGSTPDGLPYFVMEYVDGEPLRSYCDSRDLDSRSRIELVAKVCETVSYAHQKLVVHRDLKPSNILVTSKGEPKLLDFGIAKLLAPDWISSEETVTATQFRILTPEYSSPEQLRGEATTTLTDVYSLGIVLYELLAGVRPFQNDGHSPAKLAEAIQTKDPEKPSVAALFSSSSSKRDTKATSPEQVSPTGDGSPHAATRRSVPDPHALRGDIDNIVLKAIRRDPDRRYASVQELLEDIQRYLDGLPVKATADTFSYRVSKFVKRHTAGFAAAAAAVTLLTATASVAVWQAVRADRERAAAESRFNDLRTLANSLIFDIHDSIRELPGSTQARKSIVERALQYLDKLSIEGGNDMSLQTELASGYERVGDVQGNPLGPNLGETAAAIESYKKALAIRDSLYPNAGPDDRYATAMLNSKLFRIMQYSGDLNQAESYCSRATAILDEIAKADGSNALYKVTAARFNQELGDLIVTKAGGDTASALGHYSRAIDLSLSVPPSPANAVTGPDGLNLNEKILSVTQMAYKRLGQRHEMEGRDGEALAAYLNALSESEKLLNAGDPKKPQAEVVVAIALGNAGRLEARTGDVESGRERVRRAIAICENAVQSDPKNVIARSELALLHWNAGEISLIQKDAAAALESFQAAAELQQALVEQNPRDLYNLANLADTYSSIGQANETLGRTENSLGSFEKSYKIWIGMKEKGMLAGYYSHKPEQLQNFIARVKK